MVCWSLTSLCHSNGHIETMPAREINPFNALTRISTPVSQDTMIDEQSPASGHDYASNRWAIGAGLYWDEISYIVKLDWVYISVLLRITHLAHRKSYLVILCPQIYELSVYFIWPWITFQGQMTFKKLYLLNGASYQMLHETHIYNKSYMVFQFISWHLTFDKVKSRSFGVHWTVYHRQCIIRQRSFHAEASC